MHKLFTRQVGGRIILLVGLALLLYVVVPQFNGLDRSWQAVVHARKMLLVAAVLLLAVTYPISAWAYQLLALRPIRFLPTLAVQVACGLAGKLLPAGLGSLGLNATYLRKTKHSPTQAGTVVAINNTLGFAGYLVALLLAVLVVGVSRTHISLPLRTLEISGAVLASGVIVASFFIGQRAKKWLVETIKGVISSLQSYRRHPGRVVGALSLAVATPLVFTGVLFCCAWAVGADISLAVAFAVFSAGLAIGTATPTPGGVVGAEAGLTAALTAYKVPASQALAIALLYRFITYWLPMVPGALALAAVRKRYL